MCEIKFALNYFPNSLRSKVSGILANVNEGFLYGNESQYFFY